MNGKGEPAISEDTNYPMWLNAFAEKIGMIGWRGLAGFHDPKYLRSGYSCVSILELSTHFLHFSYTARPSVENVSVSPALRWHSRQSESSSSNRKWEDRIEPVGAIQPCSLPTVPQRCNLPSAIMVSVRNPASSITVRKASM